MRPKKEVTLLTTVIVVSNATSSCCENKEKTCHNLPAVLRHEVIFQLITLLSLPIDFYEEIIVTCCANIRKHLHIRMYGYNEEFWYIRKLLC